MARERTAINHMHILVGHWPKQVILVCLSASLNCCRSKQGNRPCHTACMWHCYMRICLPEKEVFHMINTCLYPMDAAYVRARLREHFYINRSRNERIVSGIDVCILGVGVRSNLAQKSLIFTFSHVDCSVGKGIVSSPRRVD